MRVVTRVSALQEFWRYVMFAIGLLELVAVSSFEFQYNANGSGGKPPQCVLHFCVLVPTFAALVLFCRQRLHSHPRRQSRVWRRSRPGVGESIFGGGRYTPPEAGASNVLAFYPQNSVNNNNNTRLG